MSTLDRVLNDFNLYNFASGLRSGSGNINFLSNIHEHNEGIRFIKNCWKLGKTVLKAKKVVGSHPLVTNHRTTVIATIASIIFFNIVEMANNQTKRLSQGYGGSFPPVRIVASSTIAKATTVGIFILNIALTAYEWNSNPGKVVVSVAALGISVLHQQNMLPEPISLVWDVLPLQLAGIAFYYGNAVSRMIITVEVIAGLITKR